MPATSPSDCSSTSARNPFLSQYLRYMRSIIDAQSCASVPPAPAWMSMKQLFGSSGLWNMRRNSRSATFLPILSMSDEIEISVASSFSARFWSLQTAGSASDCSTALRRFCLPSRSKIPPQLGGPGGQVLEQGVDLIDAFGFHGLYSPALRSFQ